MVDTHYNLHDLLRVCVKETSPGTCSKLTDRLARFEYSSPAASPADITVLPLKHSLQADPADRQMSEEFGCFPVVIDGAAHLGFMDSSMRPTILVRMEPPYTLQYTATPRADKKLYGCFLFLLREVLSLKNAALLHCAAISTTDRSALIFGPRGSKKTLLALSLLQAGWKYTAEDKAILHDNKLWLYSSELPIKPAHLALFPELATTAPLNAFKKTLPVKMLMRTLAHQLLPRLCWKAIDRRLHLLRPVEVNALFPDTIILEQTRPTDVILLKVGQTFQIKEIDQETATHALCVTQQLTFNDMESMSELNALYVGNQSRPPLYDLIHNCIRSCRYVEITLPHATDIHSHLEAIQAHLHPAH